MQTKQLGSFSVSQISWLSGDPLPRCMCLWAPPCDPGTLRVGQCLHEGDRVTECRHTSNDRDHPRPPSVTSTININGNPGQSPRSLATEPKWPNQWISRINPLTITLPSYPPSKVHLTANNSGQPPSCGSIHVYPDQTDPVSSIIFSGCPHPHHQMKHPLPIWQTWAYQHHWAGQPIEGQQCSTMYLCDFSQCRPVIGTKWQITIDWDHTFAHYLHAKCPGNCSIKFTSVFSLITQMQ